MRKKFKVTSLAYKSYYDINDGPYVVTTATIECDGCFNENNLLDEICKSSSHQHVDYMSISRQHVDYMMPAIDRIIFNNPATIVFWTDGMKTVVKAHGDDTFSKEHGLAMAIAEKYLDIRRRHTVNGEDHSARGDMKRLVSSAEDHSWRPADEVMTDEECEKFFDIIVGELSKKS